MERPSAAGARCRAMESDKPRLNFIDWSSAIFMRDHGRAYNKFGRPRERERVRYMDRSDETSRDLDGI